MTSPDPNAVTGDYTPAVGEHAGTRTNWRPPADPPDAPPTVATAADPTDPSLPALEPLPFVAGFDVLTEAGRGGMGVVYKAREFALNRLVALKMVLGSRTPSAEELIRFRLEAEVAARVRHPNVVQIYESGTHQGQPYLVMEWVDGGTLADMLKSARLLPPDVAARLVALLARAVYQAHVNGVVHRDLKPGNVLLARSERPLAASRSHATGGSSAVTLRIDGRAVAVVPKVTDFGLAKLTEGDVGLTQTGRVMGTPEFMAPEQAAGNTRGIGPAADVYALGAMLYQMVAGHPPFRGENTYAVLKRVIEDEPPSLRTASARVPADLETVCLKCLRKEPGDRYPSAAALADDLEAFLAGRPIAARRVGAAERAWKFARRNPLLSGLATACGVLLVGGLAGVTWQWRQAVAARVRAEGAEREATDARRTAEAVNTFLVADMLAAASPEKAQGRAVTVLSVLDEAAVRVGDGLPGEPAVEAGVRDAIGRSYRTLGQPRAAEPHLRKALAVRTELSGPDHPDTLRSAGELAQVLDDAGEWADAEDVFRDVEGRAMATLGADHPMSLGLRLRYALALHAHGRGDEALARMRAAVEDQVRVAGSHARESLKAVNDLGLIRFERKELSEAARLLGEAYTGREAALGANHPDTLESGNNLALVREAEGRADEAERLLAAVVQRSKKVRGYDHPDTLSAESNLGMLLARQRRYAEAASHFRDALKAAADTPGLGAVHPLTLKFKHNLGTAQLGQKDFPAAEQTVGEVYRVRQAVLPAGHPDTFQAGHDLGVVLASGGKLPAAFERFGEVLTGRRAGLGDAHPDTVLTAVNRAEVGLRMPLTADQRAGVVRELTATWKAVAGGKIEITPPAARLLDALSRHEIATAPTDQKAAERSREYTLAGYRIRKELCEGKPEEWYAVATATSQFLINTGDAAVALPAAEDALTAARRITPDPNGRLINALVFLGQLRLRSGRPEDAISALREGYELTKERHPDTFALGQTANLLGVALSKAKRYDAAELLLIEGYELLARHAQAGVDEVARSRQITTARAAVIEALDAQGKNSEAEVWRKK